MHRALVPFFLSAFFFSTMETALRQMPCLSAVHINATRFPIGDLHACPLQSSS